jgi:hypothetical protein
MKRNIMSLVLAAGMGLAPACMIDEDLEKPSTDDTKTDDSDGKAERWNNGDAPSGFAANLEYKLSALPLQGEAANKPWASNYWPTYEDSINHKWAGPSSDSAAKKYEKAFGGTNVEDKVSQYYGIDKYKSSRTNCTTNTECDSAIGESCSKRAGATEGVCIPTWWGICHAWAPLAVMHPEPLHKVVHNGVTFEINDIKAMLTLAFDRTQTKFISQRCNTVPDDIERDNYGRPTDIDCRNTNAATLHIIAANYLGLRSEGFVYDRTYSDQVWNQPIRSFEITKQDEVTARQANEILGVKSAGGRTTNASSTVAKDAWFHHEAIAVNAGEGFTVQMSGSDDADLYVNFGSQATTSTYACRPYAGGSAEECALTVPAGATQAFVSVQGYAATSNFQLAITAGGGVPDDYFFNTDSNKYFHVKMDLDYITESSAETNASFGDDQRYVRTDHYEYILELQGDEIIGGEYIGASKTNHPDFLWLPVARTNSPIAGGALDYAKIKLIYDLSMQTSTPPPAGGGVQTVNDAATVAKNIWKHYGPYTVADGGQLKAVITGSGDADLYVRKSSAPTPTEYACRPYKNGSAEECTVTGAGTYYVGVRGYAATSDFDLTIEYGGTGGTTPPPVVTPPTTIAHLNVQGDVAQDAVEYYTLEVIAGTPVKFKTFSSKDVDLYIQMGSQPTTDAYLMRAWTTSGNETISYTPTSNGTMHIMVHGYEAGSYTLRTE